MRRQILPTSSPAIEARFWRSEMIGSRGELAVTWNPAAVDRLRDQMRSEGANEDDPRLRVVERLHASAVELQQLEERLVALDIARPTNWETKINDLLRQILLKLIQASKREAIDIARWAFRAMTDIGFTPPEGARETARELLYAAALRVGRLPQAEGPLRVGVDLPAWITAAIKRELLDWASHVIVVFSEAIASASWTWDLLGFVDDKLKPGKSQGSVIAFVQTPRCASLKIRLAGECGFGRVGEPNERFDLLRFVRAGSEHVAARQCHARATSV